MIVLNGFFIPDRMGGTVMSDEFHADNNFPPSSKYLLNLKCGKATRCLKQSKFLFQTRENRKRNCKKVATTHFGLTQEQELELSCAA